MGRGRRRHAWRAHLRWATVIGAMIVAPAPSVVADAPPAPATPRLAAVADVVAPPPGAVPVSVAVATAPPTTQSPTTQSPTTQSPTTVAPTPVAPTVPSTTAAPVVAVTLPPAEPVDLAGVVMARLQHPWQGLLADWTVSFLGPRRGYRGATFPGRRLIEIYVDPGDRIEEVAHITAHEIGHALDVTLLRDADRAAFLAARGHDPDTPWWVADGANDFASGAGDWAECFAWSQAGGNEFHSRLGPPPDAAQLAVMSALLG